MTQREMLSTQATAQPTYRVVKSPYLLFADVLLWANRLRNKRVIPDELISFIVQIYHNAILPSFSCFDDSVSIAVGRWIFRMDFEPTLGTEWPDIRVQQDIRGIVSGKHFMMAWTATGRYMEGNNSFGELGLGHYNNVHRIVFANDHSPIISAACGDRFTVVIRAGGELFGWGQLPGWGIAAFPIALGFSNASAVAVCGDFIYVLANGKVYRQNTPNNCLGAAAYAWAESATSTMGVLALNSSIIATRGSGEIIGSFSDIAGIRGPIIAMTPIFRYPTGANGGLDMPSNICASALVNCANKVIYCPSERFYNTLGFAQAIHLTLPMWAFMTTRGIYTTKGSLRMVYQF